MVGLKLDEATSELEPVQDIQFLGLRLRLDEGRASLPISKAREIIARTVPNILPVSSVVHRRVPVHGITQLGLRSHPTGTTTHEAPTTLLFTRSDRPVSIRVSGASVTPGSGESFPPNIQGSGDNSTHRAKYPPSQFCRTQKSPSSWDHSTGPPVSSHWDDYT